METIQTKKLEPELRTVLGWFCARLDASDPHATNTRPTPADPWEARLQQDLDEIHDAAHFEREADKVVERWSRFRNIRCPTITYATTIKYTKNNTRIVNMDVTIR